MSSRTKKHIHLCLALGGLLMTAGPAAAAREAAPRPEVPAPETVTLRGAEVPFAVRADSLLGGLAQMRRTDLAEGTSHTDGFLRSLGLEPGSAGAHELVEASLALEEMHPGEPPAAAAGGGTEAQRRWNVERYRRVGETLGRWLHDRDAEGWAVEPLLDRLLNGAHLTVTVFSTDSQALTDGLDAETEALQESVRRELGSLPRRLER